MTNYFGKDWVKKCLWCGCMLEKGNKGMYCKKCLKEHKDEIL
jgi:hypothetical protein